MSGKPREADEISHINYQMEQHIVYCCVNVTRVYVETT